MPIRDLDVIFYIQKPPAIEFRDGMFHLCYEVGRKATFEIVMPPKAFMEARMLGSEVLAQWQADQLPDPKKVRPLKRKR